MPTETKPQRETWRDWEPEGTPEPELLLTRDHVLDQLRDEGFIVSRNDMRNWQTAGVIPYGINRWHEGAVRTLYPGWAAPMLRSVRTLQGEGRKLPEIRDRIRARWRDRTELFVIGVDAKATGRVVAKSGADSQTLLSSETARVEKTIDPPADLAPRLADLARLAERALGGRFVRAEVRLIDEHGSPLVLRFTTDPPNNGCMN
jgi:hypothetical protein